VEAGVEGQILKAEDQLFILMEAGHLIAAIRGMGAPKAGLCYEPAESLARSLNRSPSLYLVLVGQWRQSLNHRQAKCDAADCQTPLRAGAGAE
jgi:hypothetical protein